jgi:MBG domain/Bacterial Ig-like domain (group 3)/Putative Ig domain/NHL repeat
MKHATRHSKSHSEASSFHAGLIETSFAAECRNSSLGMRLAIGLFAMLLLSSAAFAQSCTGTGTGGCQQVMCPNGGTTAVSGTVYAPNGTDPLPNILVYIPTTTLNAFTDGVSTTNPTIDDAATLVSGSPLVQTTTAADGTFTLTNVPPGSEIPIVIQAGRWRRQFVISTVSSCQTTPLTTVVQGGPSSLAGFGESTSIRFPQTQGEGDIPKMALATGKADALECTLRKVGIADTEFTDYTVNVTSGGSGPGRVNLFEGSGDSGVKAGTTVHTEDTLVGSSSSTFSGSLLGGYNILVFPCQGDSNNYTTADGRNNAIAFTGAGGRIFATHHSAFYIDENSPIDTAANWTSDTSLTDGNATINTTFADGSTLAQWLQNIGATTTLGQVAMTNLFNDQSGVNPPTESWATLNSDSDVMQLSFYTPVGAAAADQYGRVMFNEYHVDNTTTSSSVTFPNECTGTMAKTEPMSAQEHMLEYSLFALMNFAVPVVSTDVSIAITTSPATFTGGDQADTVTVTVTNDGTSAIATNPTVTLAVTLPAGLTAISMVDPSGNWSCNASTLSCTLLNSLAANASNSVTLTVSVAANVAAGNASVGATVSSSGFVASTTGNVSLTVNIAPAGTVTGPLNTTATSTNVGTTTTPAATVNFAVSAGTTISAILVVTEGFTGKDFTNAGSGTCAVQNYSSATTCTVVVNFSPLYPGLRNGAVEIIGPSNTLLDTAYISGVGTGPEATFQPGTQSAVASESGSTNFDDVAVDIQGDVYIVDYPNNQILKETFLSGSYSQSVAFNGLNGPKGTAIDGAGNLYIANTTGSEVLKETLVNGSYSQSTVGSGLSSPDGVAVDGQGNVYIADSLNNRVLLETLSNGAYLQTTIAGSLSIPWRVAVDIAGNVYITDTGNNQVVLETLSNGNYVGSVLVTGLNAPLGVAVDGNGTVYIADTGNNRVLQEVLVSGSYVQNVLVSGLNAPRAVTVDQLGNLYIADYGDNTVYREDYSDPPSLSFDSTTVNTASADSPQTVSLINFGNAALTAVSPGITGASDFPQLAGNPADCTTSFSLAATISCTLRIEFDPQSAGAKSESLVLTDNNLNSSSTTQTIALSGTATAASSVVLSPTSLTAPAIGSSYSQVFSASGGTNPYTFTVSSGSLPAGLSLSAGGVLSGTPTAVGTFSFTVQAQDSTSAGSGGPLSGSQSFSVTIAAPTIFISPSTLPNGTAGSAYSQTLSANGGSGTYGYAATTGSLPSGLSLNSTTGALTGTPTAAGGFTFTVTATDTVTTGSGAPYTGSQNYSLTVSKATATVTLSNLSQTYNGSPLAATATTSPLGLTVVLTYNGSTTAPTSAGGYTVVATINDPNYQGSTTGTLTIGKAQPTVSWPAPAAITYGTALSATQLNASVTEIPGAFVYTPASGTVLNAGANQTLSVTFTPTDTTDYANATQTAQITVNKAQPTVTWLAPAAITYGTALSATQLNASVTGIPGVFVYTPASGTVLNAGANQALSVTFTPTDAADYTSATQTVQLTVNKTQPAITWPTPTAITYGTALSATQLDASTGVAGAFVYSPAAGTVLSAGANQTLSVTFTPTNTADYTNATQTVQLTVNKAQPAVNWTAPSAITYGTALSATQLNASVTGIPGAFLYTPAAGTVLNAGANQTLSVTFTPTDTADYMNATQTVQLTVNKAQPAVNWATPSAISYGTALSATQLNASVTGIPGTFVYTPAAGTVLSAGANQTLSVTFTPTDTTDYASVTQSVQITVSKASVTATVTSNSNPALSQTAVMFTATVSSAAGTPTGSVTFMDGATLLGSSPLSTGTASFSTSSLAAGSHSITAVYSGDTDFASASSSPLSQAVLQFTVSPVSSSGGAGGGSETVPPGGTGTYTIAITPTTGTTFPTITYLTVTGLPSGATATLATSGWKQVAGTEWSLPAFATLSDVSLSFHLPSSTTTALTNPDASPRNFPRLPGALLLASLLLAAFAVRLRQPGARLRWAASVWLLGATSLAAVTGLAGCASHNGFFGEQAKSYVVTVTVTTGALSHSTNVTLTVE